MAKFDFKSFFKQNKDESVADTIATEQYYQEQKKFNEQMPKEYEDRMKLKEILEVGLEGLRSGSSFADGEFGDGQFTGNTPQERLWNLFTSSGYTKEATAGIMGNIQQESRFNTASVNSIGASGLAQWLDGRKKMLKEKAAKAGKEWTDLDTQLEFMKWEFEGGESTSASVLKRRFGGLDNFKNSKDIAWATKAFHDSFERSGDGPKEMALRVKYSNEHYEKFKNYVAPSGGEGDGKMTGVFGKPSGGAMSSPYGMRFHPVHKKMLMHTGVDLTSTAGLDIIAIDGGTVSYAKVNGGYGNCVLLDHGNKGNLRMGSLYAHLASMDVKTGQKVSKNQRLGTMGTTGTSTGVHLHFEIHVNGKHQNPANYLKF